MMSRSILDLVTRSVVLSGVPAILVRASSHGSASRIAAAFPSLPEEWHGNLAEDGVGVLEFDDAADARTAFSQICQDILDESGCVEGTVSLVTAGGSTVFQIHSV